MAVTLSELANVLNLNAKDIKVDHHVYGEVKSINSDKTYEVALNGSDTTTRCARLAGAKIGDTVLVTILANGYAVVTSTVGGDTDAADALEIAGDTAQHVWVTETGDDTGLHITEITKEDFLVDPDNGGGNLLAKTDGLYMRDGLTKLAEFKPSDVKIISMDDPVAATYLEFSPRNVKWVHDPAFVPSQIIPEETITTPLRIAYINKGLLDGYYTDVIEVEIASIEYKEANRTLFNIGIGSETPSGVSGVVLIGRGLSAGSDNQVILGKNNKQDANNKYAFIIGNGRSVALMSNAFAVAWDGETSIALDVSATTGTTDGDLYAALTTLGWATDVIE